MRMARTSIWMIRHGQTTLNRQRRYQGATDAPLTEYGRQQAMALALRLRRLPFSVAIVSPCRRARDTAALIVGERGIVLIDDERWREAHHGCWEGLTYRDVCERFPDEARRRMADPLHGRPAGGESLAEVAERVATAWAALLREHAGERVLLVTHATPIQLVLCALNDLAPTAHWRWRIDLGSLTAIDSYNGVPIIRMVNEQPRHQHRATTL